ncbi:MAG: NAD(P)H-dependent oxidoreductase [Patescibacteria group bacterium]
MQINKKSRAHSTEEFLDPQNKTLRALVLLGTLKSAPAFSHTQALSEILLEHLSPYNVKGEVVRLVNYRIKPGVESNEGKGDDWPKILAKIFAADIIIFATPIWWGTHSSLLQRCIERMDALNDELLETGKSELANKIGGMVITGAEDGAQHVIGNLCDFMLWNGLTLPPACSLSYLGPYSENKTKLLKFFRKQKSTTAMARVMARNLVYYARLLKANPLQSTEKGIMKSIAPGTVGLGGDVKK